MYDAASTFGTVVVVVVVGGGTRGVRIGYLPPPRAAVVYPPPRSSGTVATASAETYQYVSYYQLFYTTT